MRSGEEEKSYLSWINRALNDVEDGDVAALASGCGHHDILRLCQSAQIKSVRLEVGQN